MGLLGTFVKGRQSAKHIFVAFLSALLLFSKTAQPEDLGNFGAFFSPDGKKVTFRLFSKSASRVRLDLFAKDLGEDEAAFFYLEKEAHGIWSIALDQNDLPPELRGQDYLLYGYRTWGSAWHFDENWEKGSEIGFIADVAPDGDRSNPNKLLIDPETHEISHDPITPAPPRYLRAQTSLDVYLSGPEHRSKDSGKVAPKSVVFRDEGSIEWEPPNRPFDEEIIYKVNLRGFTKSDPSIPPELQGTYAGAVHKIPYLKELGVTAIEFQPVAETQNDMNDILRDPEGRRTAEGAQYWGYMTEAFNAVDRRYATLESRKKPGGATREFRAMVREFNRHGIKVFLDVVYNHTAEAGSLITSWRGIDNPTYYQLDHSNQGYCDTTGCGNNFNTANQDVRRFIRRSIRYWVKKMGVSGFRFDLAAQLGNSRERGSFQFDKMDPENVLNRLREDFPGIVLIAEPWNYGYNEQGNFPLGWAEWNGVFRDTLRRHQNKRGYAPITPAQIADVLSATWYLFEPNGRKPWHSINFMTAPDGLTAADLYRYNGKVNDRPWPYGPVDGGMDQNDSWDQDGDARLQRQAQRNCMAFLMLAAGVPMINGGDEFGRSLYGINNPYPLDNEINWLDWALLEINSGHFEYTKNLIKFRKTHSQLRPKEYHTRRVEWLKANAQAVDTDYWHDPAQGFLSFRVQTPESPGGVKSIYVAYNGNPESVHVSLPQVEHGGNWHLSGDTSYGHEATGNFFSPGEEKLWPGPTYSQAGRSIVVMVEK